MWAKKVLSLATAGHKSWTAYFSAQKTHTSTKSAGICRIYCTISFDIFLRLALPPATTYRTDNNRYRTVWFVLAFCRLFKSVFNQFPANRQQKVFTQPTKRSTAGIPVNFASKHGDSVQNDYFRCSPQAYCP